MTRPLILAKRASMRSPDGPAPTRSPEPEPARVTRPIPTRTAPLRGPPGTTAAAMAAPAPVAPPPPPRVAAPETAGPHNSSPKPLVDHHPPRVGQAAPPALLETAYAVLDDYLEEGRVYAEARRARGAAALDAARRGGPAAPTPPGAPDVVELIRRAAVEGLGALAPALGQVVRTSADLMSPPREVHVRPVARGDDIWSRPNTISSPGSSPGAPPRS